MHGDANVRGGPTGDLDRFNRLVALAERRLLNDDELTHINNVYRTAARWGWLTQAFSFLTAAIAARVAIRFGRSSSVPKWRYFDAAERAEIDAILAKHE